MCIRRPAAATHEAAEELQPAGFDPDHVTPFGAADGAVSHIADKVHGVSLGFLVPAKLQQVVVVFRKRLQEPWCGRNAVGQEANLPTEKQVGNPQCQTADQADLEEGDGR